MFSIPATRVINSQSRDTRERILQLLVMANQLFQLLILEGLKVAQELSFSADPNF